MKRTRGLGDLTLIRINNSVLNYLIVDELVIREH